MSMRQIIKVVRTRLDRANRCGCGSAATHKLKGVPSCDGCTAKDVASGLYGSQVHRNGQSAQRIYQWDSGEKSMYHHLFEPEPMPGHVLEMFALVERRVSVL